MIPERIFVSFEHPSGKHIGLEKRKMYVASELKLLPTDIEYIPAPQWVSVEDRLPETNEGYATAYLVMAKRYEEQDILFYGIGYHWESGWEVKGTYAQVVTHWQPLPAPPEVE